MGSANRIYPSGEIDLLPSRRCVAGTKSTCKSSQQRVTDIRRSGIHTRQALQDSTDSVKSTLKGFYSLVLIDGYK